MFCFTDFLSRIQTTSEQEPVDFNWKVNRVRDPDRWGRMIEWAHSWDSETFGMDSHGTYELLACMNLWAW